MITTKPNSIVSGTIAPLPELTPGELATDAALTIGQRLAALVAWRLRVTAREQQGGAATAGDDHVLFEIDDAIDLLLHHLRFE